MVIDSSQWYMEGLLNFENACNGHQNTLDIKKDSLIIHSVNGVISLGLIDSILTYFTNKLKSFKAGGNDSTFIINLVNIDAKQNGNSDSYIFDMEAALGWVAPPSYNYYPFYDDLLVNSEWWGGKCANSDPPYFRDARSELEIRFNHPANSLGSGYFIDVQYIWIASGTNPSDPNHPNPGPNSHQDMMFWSYDLPYLSNLCLPKEELNYYLSTFSYLQNKYRIGNLTFSNVYVDKVQCNGGGTITDYCFNYFMYYGTFIPKDPD